MKSKGIGRGLVFCGAPLGFSAVALVKKHNPKALGDDCGMMAGTGTPRSFYRLVAPKD